MKKVRKLMRKSWNGTAKDWGTMGVKTNVNNVMVGDLISCVFNNGRLAVGLAIEHEKGLFSLMGALGSSLKTEYKEVQTVVPHNLVTIEMIDKLHFDCFIIDEIEYKPKPMTIEQIEEKLGYSIQIVEG